MCDLSDLKDAGGNVIGWAHKAEDTIAIDPVLGRIAFPENALPPERVHVTYHYGFSAEMGGGEYGRAGTFTGGLAPVIKVPSQEAATIQAALDRLAASGGVVEIENNDYYVETPVIKVAAGKTIELRAADERRPVLVLDGELVVVGGDSAEVTLNGLLISGGLVRIPSRRTAGHEVNQVRKVRLRHCTLVPGPSPAIEAVAPGSSPPPIEVPAQPARPGSSWNPRTPSSRSSSASSVGCAPMMGPAYASLIASWMPRLKPKSHMQGLTGTRAGAPLEVQNSTIIGKVHTSMMTWPRTPSSSPAAGVRLRGSRPSAPSDCSRAACAFPIYPQALKCRGPITANRNMRKRRHACARCSPPCVTAMRAIASSARAVRWKSGKAPMTRRRWAPFTTSIQPQREANLRARLDEYLRFGLEAGIFYAS